MVKNLRLIMAQLDFLVGDIEGNANKIIEYSRIAKQKWQADLVIFPELAITGYPAEDLLFRNSLYERIEHVMPNIMNASDEIDILFGLPIKKDEYRYNAAMLLSKKKIIATYYKMCLPNYSVFDEVRYFKEGQEPVVISYHGIAMGITICEDLWHKEPLTKAVEAGADFIISINASPFDMNKHEARVGMLRDRAKECNIPIVYVNCVGSQDELVFDGGSLVMNEEGDIEQRGPFYQQELLPVDLTFNQESKKICFTKQSALPLLSQEARIYGALVLGVRDYIEKNHFSSAIIGLSGGIDSALTLAIAVDAIGADGVEGVLMPSHHTSTLSIDAAQQQAALLKVKTSLIPITSIYTAFMQSLEQEFAGYQPNITEENLQARCRANILMAISNKKGGIVLSTGNKSEISVGYCTLYGDMVGGFCVLKDIPKTLVYRLAQYRNQQAPVIPKSIIEREPTAELAPNQKDQDTLPPYSVLDQILELYVELDKSYKDIVELGFNAETVKKIILMVDNNEYKRRQGAPGVRITRQAFGRDRRYPITSGYSNYLRFA